ncbi:MAG: hypothetical protein WC516_09510 [Patescibacteria group bacterium]|jgi:hypothetical protein
MATKQNKQAKEIPVVSMPEYKAIQFNRNASVFTEAPTNDYMVTERFCHERLFQLHTEQKQIESIRSQNRLTFKFEEDHETANKINAIFDTGLFTIEKAIEMVCNTETKPAKQTATTKPDMINDIPVRYNRIYNCLTGIESRKNLTEKEKSEYGKCLGYFKAINKPDTLPNDSPWRSFTGNKEADLIQADNMIKANGKNYQWYKQTVSKYHEKIMTATK